MSKPIGIYVDGDRVATANPYTVKYHNPNEFQYYMKRENKYYFRNPWSRLIVEDVDYSSLSYGDVIEVVYE